MTWKYTTDVRNSTIYDAFIFMFNEFSVLTYWKQECMILMNYHFLRTKKAGFEHEKWFSKHVHSKIQFVYFSSCWVSNFEKTNFILHYKFDGKKMQEVDLSKVWIILMRVCFGLETLPSHEMRKVLLSLFFAKPTSKSSKIMKVKISEQKNVCEPWDKHLKYFLNGRIP